MITYEKFIMTAIPTSPEYFDHKAAKTHKKWCAKKEAEMDGEMDGADSDEMDEVFCRGWLIDEITSDIQTLTEIEQDGFNEEQDEKIYRCIAEELKQYAEVLVELAKKKERKVKSANPLMSL